MVVGDAGVYDPRGPVASHIAAASPEVVQALCERVRELEAEGPALVGSVDLRRPPRARGEAVSDAIEMKVRLWANVITPVAPPLRYSIAGIPGVWVVMPDGDTARVDGGDPGDEDASTEPPVESASATRDPRRP